MVKQKFTRNRVSYYANSLSSRRILLLGGDVETNPGWEDSSREKPDYLPDVARTVRHASNNFNVAYLNIRSLSNKQDEVRMLLRLCRVDILALTETKGG